MAFMIGQIWLMKAIKQKKADEKKSLKTQKMYAIANKKEKQDEELEMSF